MAMSSSLARSPSWAGSSWAYLVNSSSRAAAAWSTSSLAGSPSLGAPRSAWPTTKALLPLCCCCCAAAARLCLLHRGVPLDNLRATLELRLHGSDAMANGKGPAAPVTLELRPRGSDAWVFWRLHALGAGTCGTVRLSQEGCCWWWKWWCCCFAVVCFGCAALTAPLLGRPRTVNRRDPGARKRVGRTVHAHSERGTPRSGA